MRGTIVLRRYFGRTDAPVLVGVIVLYIAFSIANPLDWLSGQTQSNVLQYTSFLGLVAIGESILIVCKEIDLSVGSVYGLAGIAFLTFVPSLGVFGALVATLVLAAAIGLVNAFLVLRARLNSVIVTLGGLFFYRGVIYVTTGGIVGGASRAAMGNWLMRVLGATALGLDVSVFWLVLVLVGFTVLLTRMRFGNHLFAVGGDDRSARSRGVAINRIKMLGFVGSSLLAAFAAVLTVSNSPSTHVTAGTSLELEAIAAAVIGGVALSGGRGSVLGAVLGAFFLTAVRYEIIALGAPPAWYESFVGLVLVVAVVVNTVVARRFSHASS